MELYIKLPNRIENILGSCINTIEQLLKEYKKVDENVDTSQMIKLAYDLKTISNLYDEIRGDYDPYYKKALYFREEFAEAVNKDDLNKVVDIAKEMGFTQSDICRDLKISNSNLSSHLKGKNNTLSIKKRNLIFEYVRGILY